MSSLAEVAQLSNVDVAARGYAKATDRLLQIQADLEGAFGEYDQAQHRMREQGITADLELGPGMAAAFSSWKQARAAEEGRDVVRSDDEAHGWPLREITA